MCPMKMLQKYKMVLVIPPIAPQKFETSACRNFFRQQLSYGGHPKYGQKMVENSELKISIFFKAFNSETV